MAGLAKRHDWSGPACRQRPVADDRPGNIAVLLRPASLARGIARLNCWVLSRRSARAAADEASRHDGANCKMQMAKCQNYLVSADNFSYTEVIKGVNFYI